MGKISSYTAADSINDTDVFPLENVTANSTNKGAWSLIKSTLKTYFDGIYAAGDPIGTIKTWHKTMPNTPSLLDSYVECNGSTISDASSVYNGYRSPNLNGADVVLTLTWTADAGGAYATVSATDLTALAVGDDVSGSGIAASSYISDITGTTVTINDVSATGSISSTFTNDGDFIRGGSSSGVGQKDAFQGHWHTVEAGLNAANSSNSLAPDDDPPGANTVTTSVREPISDGTHGTPRTDSETRPKNRTMVYIMKIK